MATTDLGEYLLGSTPKFSAVVKNEAGTQVNATTIVIRIDSPDGTTLLADTAMTNDATGEYSYESTQLPFEPTGQLGEYSARIKATGSAGKVTPTRFIFTAVKSI